MHGITDYAEYMDTMVKVLEQEIPGAYVKSCEVGNGAESSVFMKLRTQIDELAICINDDPKFADGFVGVGYSQGGLLLRGYVEYYNHMKAPAKRLITLSGPVGGFYCGKKCLCPVDIPQAIFRLIEGIEYTDIVQNIVGPAAYWKDPYNLEEYLTGSDILPELDNIRDYDEQRKRNYLSVDKHIAFGSEKDGVITPWQSAWFGVWADNDDSTVVNMEDRPEYKQDLFGLKTMNEQGRFIAINSHLNHNYYNRNETWMREDLVPWIKMDV